MNSQSTEKSVAAMRANLRIEEKLLLGKREVAQALSISQRAVEYLIASKALPTRKIGARILIPRIAVLRFAAGDHPARLAGQRAKGVKSSSRHEDAA